MSTTPDYVIDDQTGTSLLIDLNMVLDALRSNSSNNSQPAVFSNYQFWVDTSTNILKLKTPSGNVDVCDINTGLFTTVNATTTADTLDNYVTSTDAGIANRIIRRDANGFITGDLNTGNISGDAVGLGGIDNDSTFLLDGTNLTGTLPNETSVGDFVSSGWLVGIAVAYNEGGIMKELRYKPFRKGGWRVTLHTYFDIGDIVLWASHTPGSTITWIGASGLNTYTADFTLNDGDYMVIETKNLPANRIFNYLEFSSDSSGWKAPALIYDELITQLAVT